MAYDSRSAISGSMTLDDIKDVPTLPKGHYYGAVRRYEIRENVQTKNGEVTLVDFFVGLTRPAADVDPNRLDGVDLNSYELSKSYWYTPSGMPELRDFLRSFKLPSGQPIESLYHETVGREVLCAVSPGTFKSNRTGKDIAKTNLDDMVATAEETTTDLR